MDRASNSRALIAVSCALAVLLGVMAVLQYRWATRVADADAERTKANLESAASLNAAIPSTNRSSPNGLPESVHPRGARLRSLSSLHRTFSGS